MASSISRSVALSKKKSSPGILPKKVIKSLDKLNRGFCPASISSAFTSAFSICALSVSVLLVKQRLYTKIFSKYFVGSM